MLVLFAIMLPLFLAMGAIAVDVGYWYVVRKAAQDAADAAALAAAQELPDQASAVSYGQNYVARNLSQATAAVVTPYNGNAAQVEVTVTRPAETFFGGLFGILEVTVSRRAVAEKEIIDTNMAIFSGSTDCDNALIVNGKDINIGGHVHSNGQYDINSAAPPQHFTAPSGTIAKENCTGKVNPPGPENAGAYYGDGTDWLPEDGEELSWPEWWVPAQFGYHLPAAPGVSGRCTYKGEHIQIDSTKLKITGQPDIPLLPNPTGPGTIVPSGTYCATGSFKISGDDHKGQITALAPLITVGGNGQDYTPYEQGMLFFTVQNNDNVITNDGPFAPGVASPPDIPPYPPCTPQPSLETVLDGNDYKWAGVIFNPCGAVKINNQDSFVGTPQLVGVVYAFQVRINGDGFNMVGTGSTGSNFLLALVE